MAGGSASENVSNDYAAGIAAGVSTVLVGHPFDTIKVKLQTQRRNAPTLQYRNAFHCAIEVLKAEGTKGLYIGATPSFLGVSLESALLFGAYSQLKTALQAGDVNAPLLSTVVPAAVLAGASVSTVLCPTELVKCRLQVQGKGRGPGAGKFPVYDGPLDCVAKTIKNEGVQGLFRGLAATCIREVVGNSCFFMTYETSRHLMLSSIGLDPSRSYRRAEEAEFQAQGRNTRFPYSSYLMEAGVGIASGGLSGTSFWLVVLPVDVAKTRIQTDWDLSGSRNPFLHLKAIHTELGIRGLYAGLGPTLARAFPANAAAIVSWEVAARLLSGSH